MRFSVLEYPEAAVGLDDMKAHLSVDHDDDDDMIEALTAGAQSGFEDADTGILCRPVAYQKIEMELKRCASAPVLFGPIDDDEPVEIVYRGSDGADVAIAGSAYRIDRADTFSPRMVALSGWPAGEDIRIRCYVGLDAADPRIGNFQSAIKLAVEKIYDGAGNAEHLDAAITALLSPYRILSV